MSRYIVPNLSTAIRSDLRSGSNFPRLTFSAVLLVSRQENQQYAQTKSTQTSKQSHLVSRAHRIHASASCGAFGGQEHRISVALRARPSAPESAHGVEACDHLQGAGRL